MELDMVWQMLATSRMMHALQIIGPRDNPIGLRAQGTSDYRALCANQALITNVGFVGAAQYSSIQTGIIQRAILTESKQGASSSNLVMAHRLGSLTFAVECLEIKPALPLLSSQRGSKNSNEISLLYILPECDMYDVDKTESSDNKEFSA
ncbi:hypothetical protein GX48_05765 [Paracoccidioides brasiliensis]|nr:hypothetical protein GX48_05765 [Paracoccidioides brasiliensis]